MTVAEHVQALVIAGTIQAGRDRAYGAASLALNGPGRSEAEIEVEFSAFDPADMSAATVTFLVKATPDQPEPHRLSMSLATPSALMLRRLTRLFEEKPWKKQPPRTPERAASRVRLFSSAAPGTREEAERADRLAAALLKAKSKVDSDLEGRLVSLEDHKGALNVVWRDSPTARETAAVERAWEECGEPSDNVRHKTVDQC